MKRLLLALALFLVPAAASAQCNGVFPNNTVCGNITGSGNLPRPTNPSAFLGAAGGTNGQIQYNNGGALGGFTMSTDVTVNTSTGVATIQPSAVTNGKLATGAANTMKGSLNGSATSDIAISSCSVAYRFTQWVSGTGWQCGISPVLPSRATAASLDLSAFSVITTQGYATAGDGGGATFTNIGTTANFLDSFVNANPTITTAGSGCTNGSYFAVIPTGGNGTLLSGNVTIAGGIMTVFQYTGTGGNGYRVGDVLTIPSSYVTCGTQPTITVTSVSTPLGSFTDTAGNHWQIVGTPFNHATQFGAVGDWTAAGGDAAATDNQAQIQALINFTARGHDFTDNGGHTGGTAFIDAGSFKVCGGLMVPNSIVLSGVSMGGTTLRECNSNAAAQNFITLGDPANHISSFYNGIHNLTLFTGFGTASGVASMVYSNSAQQGDAVYNVAIYSGNRGCVYTETGYGGTSYFHIKNLYCIPSPGAPFGVQLNYPQALNVIDGGTQFASGITYGQPYIILKTGAINVIRDTYCENGAACVSNQIAAGNPQGTQNHLDNVSGSASMSIIFSNLAGSPTGISVLQSISKNGASCVVFTGGACTVTANVLSPTVY